MSDFNTPLLSNLQNDTPNTRSYRTISVAEQASLRLQNEQYWWRNFRFRNWIGETMQTYEWMIYYLKLGYTVLIVNISITCIILLMGKMFNNEFWLHWNSSFVPLSNWKLETANVMLAASYCMQNFLYLRLCLFVACIWFIFFALTNPYGIMVDMCVFNCLMALLNLRHALSLLYAGRYVKFEAEYEQVYQNIFSEYMRRTDFAELAAIGLVREESANVVLKKRGDIVTSLNIVVTGRVAVINPATGDRINVKQPMEIIEAPEWIHDNMNPTDSFRLRVSFVTLTDCTFIKFPRESLVDLFEKHPLIKTSLRAILGIQVAGMWLRSIEIKDLAGSHVPLRGSIRGSSGNSESPAEMVPGTFTTGNSHSHPPADISKYTRGYSAMTSPVIPRNKNNSSDSLLTISLPVASTRIESSILQASPSSLPPSSSAPSLSSFLMDNNNNASFTSSSNNSSMNAGRRNTSFGNELTAPRPSLAEPIGKTQDSVSFTSK